MGFENFSITIWKDGSWKMWSQLDAEYARNDPDWLAEIAGNELGKAMCSIGS